MPLIDWRQLSQLPQLGGNFVRLLINISSLRRKGKRLFIFYLPAINELISGKGVEGNSEGELPEGRGCQCSSSPCPLATLGVCKSLKASLGAAFGSAICSFVRVRQLKNDNCAQSSVITPQSPSFLQLVSHVHTCTPHPALPRPTPAEEETNKHINN